MPLGISESSLNHKVVKIKMHRNRKPPTWRCRWLM